MLYKMSQEFPTAYLDITAFTYCFYNMNVSYFWRRMDCVRMHTQMVGVGYVAFQVKSHCHEKTEHTQSK